MMIMSLLLIRHLGEVLLAVVKESKESRLLWVMLTGDESGKVSGNVNLIV